jgi:hypothetical protein
MPAVIPKIPNKTTATVAMSSRWFGTVLISLFMTALCSAVPVHPVSLADLLQTYSVELGIVSVR